MPCCCCSSSKLGSRHGQCCRSGPALHNAAHFEVQQPPNKGNQQGAPGCMQRQHLSAVLAGLTLKSVLSFSACIIPTNNRSKQLADVTSLYRVQQCKRNWVLSRAAILIAELLFAPPHCLQSDSHMKQPHALVCAVSTMPDNVRFMQTHQVISPAKDFFTSLRRYPNMRSEVEVSMRGLRAALGNVCRAAHGVCERLVKLKVSSRSILVQCFVPF